MGEKPTPPNVCAWMDASRFEDFMNRQTRLRIRDNKWLRRWKQRTLLERIERYEIWLANSVLVPSKSTPTAVQSRGTAT